MQKYVMKRKFRFQDYKNCLEARKNKTIKTGRIWFQKNPTKWNKYHSKKITLAQNRYLNVLIDPRFQGVNRHHFNMMIV